VCKLFYFGVILGLTLRTSDCLKALGIMVLVRMPTPVRDEACDRMKICTLRVGVNASVIKHRNGRSTLRTFVSKITTLLPLDRNTLF